MKIMKLKIRVSGVWRSDFKLKMDIALSESLNHRNFKKLVEFLPDRGLDLVNHVIMGLFTLLTLYVDTTYCFTSMQLFGNGRYILCLMLYEWSK